ncbi:MAG: SPOR domain-containing protein [Deltaproteobacteria bacterium]|nr:SPOR domain-containing protein [Deltaproteobacteria bacterium]
MRDLDRIKEVREYRVTGPQLSSFLISALVFAAAVFAIGFQIGRLQSPIDVALLEPLGEDERDAGSLLADMLAENDQRALASTAPSDPPPPLSASDQSRAAAATAADEPQPEPESAPEVEEPEPEPVPELAALEPEPTPKPSLVIERVERSFPEGEEPEAVAVIEPVVPEPTSEPPTAPIALPGAPSGRGFTVQVGAFEALEEAAQTVAKLKGQGHEVFYVAAEVNGKTYHRVRVGLYPSRDAADAAAVGLQGATPHGTFVTQQP